MSNVIRNVLDGIREWNEDRRFSKHFRRIQVLDRQINITKECLSTTALNEYTDIYIPYLHRTLERLLEKRIKATKRFGRVVDSFRR